VPLHIFRNRNFALMSLIGFVLGFVMFGAMLYLPLFQQAVQGASATNSGLLLMPMLLAFMTISLLAGRATTRTGRYKAFPIVGGALMMTGLFMLAQLDTGTSRLTAGIYMAVLGAGMGFLMQITMLVAQNSVEMKDMGVASSTTTLFRTLGSSFGVAVMGALFTNQVQDEMAARGGGAAAGSVEDSAQLTAEAMAALPEPAREAYQYAVSSGTHVAFLVGAAVAVTAFVASLFVREVPLRGAGPGTKPEAPGAPEAPEGAEKSPAAPVAS
jgi:MFS family permease